MIDLSSKELEQVKRILLPGIAKGVSVWVFGSRINGEATDTSDLDLVIKGKEKIPLNVYYALKDAFEYSDLPFRIDLLDWHRLGEEFQKLILQNYEPLI